MDIPLSLTAGDTWSWTDSLADYPAPTWALVYRFRGPQSFNVTATDDGTDHALAVTAAISGTYKPGVYDWSAQVNDGTTYTTIEVGRVTVSPNLGNAAVDHRSFNVRVTEALQATIENRATTDQLSMSIAGRSLSRMSWDELLSAYDRFSRLAASESGAAPSRTYIRLERA
jgi:hypothetical protein